MEHLAFGDAEDLQSQQFRSSPQGHVPQHDLGVLRWVFAHRCDRQQLPKCCWASGLTSPGCFNHLLCLEHLQGSTRGSLELLCLQLAGRGAWSTELGQMPITPCSGGAE